MGRQISKSPSKTRLLGFHVVEVGSITGRRATDFKKLQPRWRVAVVEPDFRKEPHKTQPLKKAGIHIHPGTLKSFVDFMRRKKRNSLCYIIDMPPSKKRNPKTGDYRFNFIYFFKHLREVLHPKGEVIITTESTELLEFLKRKAAENSLLAGEVLTIPPNQGRVTETMMIFAGQPLYQIKFSIPN